MVNEKRLIDANELKEHHTVLWDEALGFCQCVLVDDIDNAPTVDAVEVIHAYWMYDDELDESGDLQAHCSNCLAFDLHAPRKKNDVPYCWRCGAKMDGDGNG